MEIDELISLVTKQVKERLEAFEKRKKVLMLGSFQGACMENLCSMLESSGFRLCGAEAYEKEKDTDDYEFVVVTKAKFREMLKQAGGNACKEKQCKPVAGSCRMDKRVVTERDILSAARDGCREITVDKRTVITPLAYDSAKVVNVRIIRE